MHACACPAALARLALFFFVRRRARPWRQPRIAGLVERRERPGGATFWVLTPHPPILPRGEQEQGGLHLLSALFSRRKAGRHGRWCASSIDCSLDLRTHCLF
jgi:hypothetical protein